MHKFEIITDENGVNALIGNVTQLEIGLLGSIEVAYSDIASHHLAKHGSIVGMSNRGQKVLHKVEFFTTSPVEYVWQQLNKQGGLKNIQAHPCRLLSLSGNHSTENSNKETQEEEPSVAETSAPDDYQSTLAPAYLNVKCSVTSLPNKTMNIKLESDLNDCFLWKAFAVLYNNRITPVGGRKFRQGKSEFANIKVPPLISVSPSNLVSLFRKELTKAEPPVQTTSQNDTNPILRDNIDFHLSNQGNLTLLKVSATGDSGLLRLRLFEALHNIECEISLARISGDENSIADTYHLKSTGSQLEHKHLVGIKNILAGDQHE